MNSVLNAFLLFVRDTRQLATHQNKDRSMNSI